jgi:large subunit ribosomal protein L13
MKTYFPNEKQLHSERKWFVVDVAGKVLGRQASEIAKILRGKHKAEYTPFLDAGDFVVVLNAEQIVLTGQKESQKMYYRHTGFPGGLKERNAAEMREKAPERIIELAVKGMLPKGSLGRQMLKKLKVYAGSEHPHEAQQPEALEL